MKTTLAISIPKPCSENWNNFTTTSTGGFCSSCSKTVFDFTKMSDDDIINFLNKKQVNTCGRFRSDQLKIYSLTDPLKINPGFTVFKAGFMGLLVLLISKPSSAQSELSGVAQVETAQSNPLTITKPTTHPGIIIKGIVKDEYDELVPGASIILKGTTVGVSADAEGRFEFPQELKGGDVLLISFIGYDTKEYVVSKSVAGEIEIIIKMDMAITMGKLAITGVYTEKQSGLNKWWSKFKGLF